LAPNLITVQTKS